MNRSAAGAVAALITVTGCHAAAPVQLAGQCPRFPPARSNERGDAVASTSFGGSKLHPPSARHTSIPAGAIEGVRIVLERGGCFGTCAAYRVEVRGTGEVLFHGDRFVTFSGDHRTRVPPQAVKCLLQDFRAADFWSLDSDYVANVTDLPTYKVSLTINSKTKVVTDYAGQAVGMPAAVTALEEAIDEIADTNSWIKGGNKTVAALEAEHVNFRSRKAADWLASAARDAPDKVVIAMLNRGTPLNGRTQDEYVDARPSAVEATAMNGRLTLLRRLIGAGAFARGGKATVSATLRASVASQRTGVVAEVLKHGPAVNDKDARGDTALALIFTGPHPHMLDKNAPDEDAAIIRLLGKYGADPNLPNSEHQSLWEQAFSKKDKDALVAIGAKPTR